MSKYSFHKVHVVRGGQSGACVMDDFGYLVYIQWNTVNHFIAPLH